MDNVNRKTNNEKASSQESITKNIEVIQNEIIEEFEDFFDWKERYQYLIELGEELPPFPDEQKTEVNKVHGCQSQVWLIYKKTDNRLVFLADSDSQIVKGILSVLLRVFSGQTPLAINNASLEFIEKIGLSKHLSMNRANGLTAMVAKIKEIAQSQLA